jgi:hypothetical protein
LTYTLIQIIMSLVMMMRLLRNDERMMQFPTPPVSLRRWDMRVKRIAVMAGVVSLLLLSLVVARGHAASQCQQEVYRKPASGFMIRLGGPEGAWGLIVPLPCCETDPIKILKGIEIETDMERAWLGADPSCAKHLSRMSPDTGCRSACSDTCARNEADPDAVREKVCTDADCR